MIDRPTAPGSDPTGRRYAAAFEATTFASTVLANPDVTDTEAVVHFGTDAPAFLALTSTDLRTGRARIEAALHPPSTSLGDTNFPAAIERCGNLLGGQRDGRQRVVIIANDGQPSTPDDPTMSDWATIAGTIRFLGNTHVYVLGVDNGDPSVQADWEAAGATYISLKNLTGTALTRNLRAILSREAFA